jgi:hypothetical protein
MRVGWKSIKKAVKSSEAKGSEVRREGKGSEVK